MEPLRVGVVGCGVIGPTHMQDAVDSELMELTAVADLIEERRDGAAQKFGAPKIYVHGQELLEDPEIDVAVLAFPAEGRAELGLKALEEGKHLLLEKPVAMNADEVQQLLDAQGDLVAATCCSRFRFTDSARAAADFIASGNLGQLRTLYCRELRPAGPMPEGEPVEWRLKKHRNGGGILMNWGCYDLDYLLGLCDWQLEPQRAFAQTWPCPPQFEPHIAPGSDAETHYTALVRCKGGTVIDIERGEYMPTAAEAAWQIIGTKGSLQLFMLADGDKQITFDDTSTENGVESRVIWEGEDEFTSTPLIDMAEAIEGNRAPATPLEHALIVQAISDAIYESAETGNCAAIQ